MKFTKLVPRVLISAIITIVALAALAVPVAADVPAPQLLIVRSGSQTETAGFAANITDDGSQIVADSYSGAGVWKNAAIVSQHPAWATFVAPDSAEWVSTTSANYGVETANEGSTWRLFKQDFELPAGASTISATLKIAADNAFEVYLNGKLVATSAPTAPVYGTVDTGTAVSAHSAISTFTIYPVPGKNLLKFVVRNWDNTGSDNPSGLAFNANVIYSNMGVIPGEGEEPGEGDTGAWYLESKFHALNPAVTPGSVAPNDVENPPFYEMIQDSSAPFGNVPVDMENDRTWIANQAVEGNYTYAAGTWTLTLYTNGNWNPVSRIGVWDPQTGFVETGYVVNQSGTWIVAGKQVELYFNAGALTIPDGCYLALEVANANESAVNLNGANGVEGGSDFVVYTNSTDGLSNLVPPNGEPSKPVPELPAVALLALGLAVIGGVVIIRNRISSKSRA